MQTQTPNPQDFNDYNVELYGYGGTLSPANTRIPIPKCTNGVFRSDSVSGTISLNKENNSSTIYRSTNDIEKTGFQPGITYFFADQNDNWNSITDKWSYDINEHQVATVTNLSPGSYRADYDTDPKNATPKGGLTMAYTPLCGDQGDAVYN